MARRLAATSSSTSFSRSRRAAEATRTSAWHCHFCTYFSPACIHSHSIRTTASIFALCGHNSDSSASPTAIAEATNHPLIDVIADSTIGSSVQPPQPTASSPGSAAAPRTPLTPLLLLHDSLLCAALLTTVARSCRVAHHSGMVIPIALLL